MTYHVVDAWPVLPEGRTLGAVAGVGVDSHGHVFVFHRGERTWPDSDVLDGSLIPHPTVAIFDGTTGTELQAWGAGFFAMPHGLTIDHGDNVWLTDVALHRVFEFSHDGRLLLALDEQFNRPTKVAVAADGSFYVSDGYGNARVVKFAPDGTFLWQWGSKGDGPGQFDLPHAVSVDASGRVYVADRNNARVQIFDADGRFLQQWKIESPNDIAFGPDGTAFIVDGRALAVVTANGSVVERVGRFGTAHGVAVGKNGTVYVADLDATRLTVVTGSARTSPWPCAPA